MKTPIIPPGNLVTCVLCDPECKTFQPFQNRLSLAFYELDWWDIFPVWCYSTVVSLRYDAGISASPQYPHHCPWSKATCDTCDNAELCPSRWWKNSEWRHTFAYILCLPLTCNTMKAHHSISVLLLLSSLGKLFLQTWYYPFILTNL